MFTISSGLTPVNFYREYKLPDIKVFICYKIPYAIKDFIIILTP